MKYKHINLIGKEYTLMDMGSEQSKKQGIVAICTTWQTPRMRGPAFWYVHPSCYRHHEFQHGTEWSNRMGQKRDATPGLLETICTCGSAIGNAPHAE